MPVLEIECIFFTPVPQTLLPFADKVEEAVQPQKSVHEKASLDKVATIKPRPSSRFLATPMDFNVSCLNMSTSLRL